MKEIDVIIESLSAAETDDQKKAILAALDPSQLAPVILKMSARQKSEQPEIPAAPAMDASIPDAPPLDPLESAGAPPPEAPPMDLSTPATKSSIAERVADRVNYTNKMDELSSILPDIDPLRDKIEARAEIQKQIREINRFLNTALATTDDSSTPSLAESRAEIAAKFKQAQAHLRALCQSCEISPKLLADNSETFNTPHDALLKFNEKSFPKAYETLMHDIERFRDSYPDVVARAVAAENESRKLQTTAQIQAEEAAKLPWNQEQISRLLRGFKDLTSTSTDKATAKASKFDASDLDRHSSFTKQAKGLRDSIVKDGNQQQSDSDAVSAIMANLERHVAKFNSARASYFAGIYNLNTETAAPARITPKDLATKESPQIIFQAECQELHSDIQNANADMQRQKEAVQKNLARLRSLTDTLEAEYEAILKAKLPDKESEENKQKVEEFKKRFNDLKNLKDKFEKALGEQDKFLTRCAAVYTQITKVMTMLGVTTDDKAQGKVQAKPALKNQGKSAGGGGAGAPSEDSDKDGTKPGNPASKAKSATKTRTEQSQNARITVADRKQGTTTPHNESEPKAESLEQSSLRKAKTALAARSLSHTDGQVARHSVNATAKKKHITAVVNNKLFGDVEIVPVKANGKVELAKTKPFIKSLHDALQRENSQHNYILNNPVYAEQIVDRLKTYVTEVLLRDENYLAYSQLTNEARRQFQLTFMDNLSKIDMPESVSVSKSGYTLAVNDAAFSQAIEEVYKQTIKEAIGVQKSAAKATEKATVAMVATPVTPLSISHNKSQSQERQ